MARYIDLDEAMGQIAKIIKNTKDKKSTEVLFQVGDAIMDCPTADVVPRSEVEELEAKLEKQDLWERLLKAESHAPIIEKAKQEVAREMLDDINNIAYMNENGDLYLDRADFAELEKKYIGEVTENE